MLQRKGLQDFIGNTHDLTSLYLTRDKSAEIDPVIAIIVIHHLFIRLYIIWHSQWLCHIICHRVTDRRLFVPEVWFKQIMMIELWFWLKYTSSDKRINNWGNTQIDRDIWIGNLVFIFYDNYKTYNSPITPNVISFINITKKNKYRILAVNFLIFGLDKLWETLQKTTSFQQVQAHHIINVFWKRC